MKKILSLILIFALLCSFPMAMHAEPIDEPPIQNDSPILQQPDEPGENPDEPGENPDEPGENPDDPGENPDDPGENPDDPGDNPDDPGENPEDPGENPDDPGENPDDPGENPEDPGENPDDPGENPDDPGENPDDPGENPEDPGENPEDPGENPEDPGENPDDPDEPEDSPSIPIIPNEPSFSFTPPAKVFYTVGETADYTGGMVFYTTPQTEYHFHLSEKYCEGFDTSTPGIKTVTVSVLSTAPKAYFTIVVLDKSEPITKMTDVKESQWFFEAMGVTMKAGLFLGDTAGTLRPNDAITRAEFAALIYRSWKNDPRVMSAAADAAAPFSDVAASKWYYEAIETCRKAKILEGYPDGTYHPEQEISRQDAILMLMRIQYTNEELAAANIDELLTASKISPVDFDEVSAYAAPAMALALGSLVQGNEKNEITPKKTITRAETATIYQRKFFTGYIWEAPQMPDLNKPTTPAAPETPNTNETVMPLIFLSPSSQFENSYRGIATTEGIQMNEIAQILKQKLEAAGYRVYLPPTNLTYKERAALSNEVGADIHIPIHSNAGGGTGTRIFYHGGLQGSKELSAAIFSYLGALTNTPLNSRNLKEDYLSLMPNGTPFHEIKEPKAEMAYIEVEFHDIYEKALWIVNHKDAIAEAIAKGIIDYCEQYLLK